MLKETKHSNELCTYVKCIHIKYIRLMILIGMCASICVYCSTYRSSTFFSSFSIHMQRNARAARLLRFLVLYTHILVVASQKSKNTTVHSQNGRIYLLAYNLVAEIVITKKDGTKQKQHNQNRSYTFVNKCVFLCKIYKFYLFR